MDREARDATIISIRTKRSEGFFELAAKRVVCVCLASANRKSAVNSAVHAVHTVHTLVVPELNPRSNRSAIGPPEALFRSIRYLCRPTDELTESYATQAGKAKTRLRLIVVVGIGGINRVETRSR